MHHWAYSRLKTISQELGIDFSEAVDYLINWRAATFISETKDDNAHLLKVEFNIMTWIKDAPNEMDSARVVGCLSKEIDDLIDAKKIVIEKPKITIQFIYPLKNPVAFDYESPQGFSRRKILECIHDGYSKIYDDEEKTGKIEPRPEGYPIDNRPRSDGKYGIWGHYINQLFIEHLTFDVQSGILHLDMGS